MARLLRLPRPTTFLYLFSLRTGTELTTLLILLNKISGFYGLLALLTGYSLSALQLSMYIYSLGALILTVILSKHIRTGSPFHVLALAWFFILDTTVNAVWTAIFAASWFRVISQHHGAVGQGALGGDGVGGKGGPEFKNVTSVDVVVAPDQGIAGEKNEAVTGAASSDVGGASARHGVLQPESISSVVAILLLWAVRCYLVLIVVSYARVTVRRYVASRSRTGAAGSKTSGMLEDPFAKGGPEGKGWRGQLGRSMVTVGRSYWLGIEDGDEDIWESIAMDRVVRNEPPGVIERERRRRSGTGPPPPPAVPQLQGQSQHLRVQERGS